MNEIQIVTFRLNQEEYALTINQVREIITVEPPTRIPKAPPFIEGLINLRGEMIPVLNLKIRFGLEGVEKASRNAQIQIVIVDYNGQVFGIHVDGVSKVLKFNDGDIDPPSLQLRERAPYVRGLVKTEKQLVSLLDVDAIFATAAS